MIPTLDLFVKIILFLKVSVSLSAHAFGPSVAHGKFSVIGRCVQATKNKAETCSLLDAIGRRLWADQAIGSLAIDCLSSTLGVATRPMTWQKPGTLVRTPWSGFTVLRDSVLSCPLRHVLSLGPHYSKTSVTSLVTQKNERKNSMQVLICTKTTGAIYRCICKWHNVHFLFTGVGVV